MFKINSNHPKPHQKARFILTANCENCIHEVSINFSINGKNNSIFSKSNSKCRINSKSYPHVCELWKYDDILF